MYIYKTTHIYILPWDLYTTAHEKWRWRCQSLTQAENISYWSQIWALGSYVCPEEIRVKHKTHFQEERVWKMRLVWSSGKVAELVVPSNDCSVFPPPPAPDFFCFVSSLVLFSVFVIMSFGLRLSGWLFYFMEI